jgi:hypothetical protein
MAGVAEARQTSPLVEQALSGENRQLTLLAAQGMLPIAPEELIPLQVRLAGNRDGEVAEAAQQALADAETRFLLPFLGREASQDVLRYFAAHPPDTSVVECILRRRDVPPSILEQLAPRLRQDLQEVLLLRQDLVVRRPTILEALESNPNLSAYARRRIVEYREHLVPRERKAAPAPVAVEEVTEEEVAEAIAQVMEEPAEGQVDEVTGLSEAQIRLLPMQIRLRLARGASRSLRQLLVRDSNKQVALAVLRNNPLTDQEIELIARSRAVLDDVLEEIARHREWARKYPIKHALVLNPKTPVAVAVRLVPQLPVRDLRNLSRDRNVADAVRSTAMRLYRLKSR